MPMKWLRRSSRCITAEKCATLAYRTLPQPSSLFLQSRLPFTLATNQVEISPVHQPLLLDGTLDQLQQLRIRPMAWSCLGGGRLFNEEGFQPLRDELAQVAHELNADSIEQVVYAWILRLPSQPLPIIGSGKIERVRSAIVAEKLSMTRQQWFRIRKAALGYDVP